VVRTHRPAGGPFTVTGWDPLAGPTPTAAAAVARPRGCVAAAWAVGAAVPRTLPGRPGPGRRSRGCLEANGGLPYRGCCRNQAFLVAPRKDEIDAGGDRFPRRLTATARTNAGKAG